MNKNEITQLEEDEQIERMTREDKPKMTKLEKLQATRDAIEAELQAQRAEHARIEQEKHSKEMEIKYLIEQKSHDITIFNQTNEALKPFFDIIGEKDLTEAIKSSMVFSYLLKTAHDMFGQNTERVALLQMDSYFRAKKDSEKGVK